MIINVALLQATIKDHAQASAVRAVPHRAAPVLGFILLRCLPLSLSVYCGDPGVTLINATATTLPLRYPHVTITLPYLNGNALYLKQYSLTRGPLGGPSCHPCVALHDVCHPYSCYPCYVTLTLIMLPVLKCQADRQQKCRRRRLPRLLRRLLFHRRRLRRRGGRRRRRRRLLPRLLANAVLFLRRRRPPARRRGILPSVAL